LKFVLFLDEIPDGPGNVALVGSKAHNLARLAQGSFLVPAGFCLTTEAYRHHLATNGLRAMIDHLLAQPGVTGGEKAHRAQQAILGADLSPDLLEAIRNAYRLLSDSDELLPLAVRSSAIVEDRADISGAGQHDTFLDVRGESALIESIKRCWASLWTHRSQSYRARLGVGSDESLAMAVLVQHMVPADWSGVAFTVDPITGADEIVVEAIPGMGEGVVSGSITPERYRIDKLSWAVREGPSARPDQPALGVPQLQAIARLAVEVESYCGKPQDIEWAHSNGQTYLLQSRPVTTFSTPDLFARDGQLDMASLLRHADETGNEIWTDDNVGEVMPGVLTRLTWSVLEPLGNDAFRYFLRRVGVRHYPNAGLFGRFYGRVYFNQSQFQRLMRRFYPSHLGQSGSGRARRLSWAQAALVLAETSIRTLLLIPFLLREAERGIQAISSRLHCAPAPETLTEYGLWLEAERWRGIGQQAMNTHVAVTIFASLFYSLLEKVVLYWGDDQSATAHLLTGLPGIKSAEMGRDLAALAAEVAVGSEVESCLLNNPPETLTDCMAGLSSDNRFARQLGMFLERHGHASLREFELAFPRWREDVGYVLDLLRNHVRARRAGRLPPSFEGQQEARRRATQAMRRRLRLGPRRLIFEILLRWAQRYCTTRENMKYSFVTAHSHLRELYLTLANQLVLQGALTEPSDLFYLARGEIGSFLKGEISREDLSEIISRHRAEHRRYEETKVTPPIIIEACTEGSRRPLIPIWNGSDMGEVLGTDKRILRGLAASAGRVTGRARVILDPRDSVRLGHNEILVAPSTNPAWAPLLLNASGLVTEVGGVLSHGAIVAREYGLPAVLNVKSATQIIHSGQHLAVDGYAGTVSVLDEA
jgi:phosphohistidine swiveling domain-containing protein